MRYSTNHYPDWVDLYQIGTSFVCNITSHHSTWDEVLEDFNNPDLVIINIECPIEGEEKPGWSLHCRNKLDLTKFMSMLLHRISESHRTNYQPPARAANNDWRRSSEKPMDHTFYGRVLELSRDGVHAMVRLRGTQETKEVHVNNLSEIPEDPEPSAIPDVTKKKNKKSWGGLLPYVKQARAHLKAGNIKKPTRSQIEEVARQLKQHDENIRISI